MPITIPHNLPAKEILEKENIFIMEEDRAYSQDIRPLTILILNLMPEKERTETQLLRLLGNSPLQVNITFLFPETHVSKTTGKLHLETFYTGFTQIKHKKYDGMIVTGAPIEHLEFENVTYWDELKDILEWSKSHVTSTLHICWGAQAGLYYHYGIRKFPLKEKCFGIFPHQLLKKNVKLVRGFDDVYYVPHSRYTQVSYEELNSIDKLTILSVSETAGVCLIASTDGKQIFLTGHPEYDANTLQEEYERDLTKGIEIKPPANYFPKNDPSQVPLHTWKSHANLLFSNWLNYYVYQETPYNWK